jgi:carboxylesterase
MAQGAEPSGRGTSEESGAPPASDAERVARADGRAASVSVAGLSARARIRCLLMHGFNGEPVDMCELDEHLSRLGFATKNLLLPGHGTSVRDFAQHGWDDWLGYVRDEARCAIVRGERVVLIGHSMGAAVGLTVAADEPRVAGVAALCSPLRLSPNMLTFVRAVKRFVRYIPAGHEDLRDRRGARQRYVRNAYTWTALTTVESLLAALPDLHQALPRVACPALVVCARNDHVVPLRDGLETFQLLGSEEKDLLVLQRSYHSVTKDVERHLVFGRVARFCEHVYATSAGGVA